MFCLFYNAETKKVHALNGSGRSSAKVDLPALRKDLDLKPAQKGSMHHLSVHTVTVPGAAAGWVDTVKNFGNGKLSLEQILTPAIELGEEGFAVSDLSAKMVSLPAGSGTEKTHTITVG
jgi:gamma-glutamyltranspeptidase / glutathione hydrolase